MEKKVKLVSNTDGTLECIYMQIKDSGDLKRVSNHSLAELDLVTLSFKNSDIFKKVLCSYSMIDDIDTDLFLVDKYQYAKKEHIRTFGLLYDDYDGNEENYLSKNLMNIAKEKVHKNVITPEDSKGIVSKNAIIIIGNFINLLNYPAFSMLAAADDNFGSYIIWCIEQYKKDDLWERSIDNYKVLREMVYIIDFYFKIKNKNIQFPDYRGLYLELVNERKKNIEQIGEIVNYNPNKTM